MKTIIYLLTLAGVANAAAPVLFFSDLTDGPKSGGENNKGAYVCVTGRGFGATRGSSTITIGGNPVDNYPVWGTGNAVARGDDKACFQLGNSVPTGAQTIQMTVGGVQSNTLPFYVRVGGFSPTVADGKDAIYCISSSPLPVGGTTPSDSNDGHFGTTPGHGCWATIFHVVSDLNAVFNNSAYMSAILYMNNVSMGGNGAGVSNPTTYGYLYGGAANANQAFSAYPTSGEVVWGTLTRSQQTFGTLISKSYMTLANITMLAFTNAFRSNSDVVNSFTHNWRLVGNKITCESTAGQSACANVNNARTYQILGNIMYNVALTEPHGYMPTSIPSSPYDSADAILVSLVSDGTTCTANTQNSPGDIFVGDGPFTGGAGIEFMNGPAGIGASGFISSVTQVGANFFKFGCSVAAGTYNSSTNPFMWYTGRTKFQHTWYNGSMTTDYEMGWNEFSNNWTNQDIFSHSTQQALTNPFNAGAQGYWGVPQPLRPDQVQQYGWPSMSLVDGCTSGTCVADHTYYIQFSWMGNGGETDGSHETVYNIPAGKRLSIVAPPGNTNYPGVTTPNFVEGGECGSGCVPTQGCFYVGTSSGQAKQQICANLGNFTWTEPVSGISLTGPIALNIDTQTAAYRGGYTGTHVFIHDNLIHGGASDGMRIEAVDPTPVNMWGDSDTGGGVFIYNNIVYKQAKPYYRAANSGSAPQPSDNVGPYYKDNQFGSAICINIGPTAHNGPTPQGTILVENNTCYDINAYWPDGVTFAGMTQNARYFYDPFDIAGNNSCATTVQENNNIFFSTSSATVTPWVSIFGYTQSSCAHSMNGQKNIWWSSVDNSRVPPDASTPSGNSSCVFGGINVGKTCFTNNITSDPKFTNAGTGDFTLLAGSPAIGTGINTTPTRDFYGNPRTLGAYSIGAIEALGAVVPCRITPTSLPTYTATQTVSVTFTTTGSCGPSTWVATGLTGSGLSINSSTGVLSSGGVVAGTYNANFTYDTASQPITITIVAQPAVTTSGSLGNVVQGNPFSHTITTTGGVSPLNCSLFSGSLTNSGINLVGCVLSGTAATPATYTIKVVATDNNNVPSAPSGNISFTVTGPLVNNQKKGKRLTGRH